MTRLEERLNNLKQEINAHLQKHQDNFNEEETEWQQRKQSLIYQLQELTDHK